ncbi:MAG: hypothetical protein HGB28_06055, partial [Oscillochloris sp.]|nr:hypothetical protein [Oscillochloris sp.]
MNVIGRTLVLMLVALLVAGATYALGSAGLIGGAAGGQPGTAIAGEGGPPAGDFHAGPGRGSGGDHESGEAGGAIEVAKNFSIIAVI